MPTWIMYPSNYDVFYRGDEIPVKVNTSVYPANTSLLVEVYNGTSKITQKTISSSSNGETTVSVTTAFAYSDLYKVKVSVSSS